MTQQLITEARIPLPIQVIIDDVGWMKGEDGHLQGEPWRTGMPRDHVIEDYMALIRLGMGLKMRPQAAMILCDWDRDNLLRALPSATWQGEAWTTPPAYADQCAQIARLLNDHTHAIELAMHGLAHEHWNNGVLERAEWHDAKGRMRPKALIEERLEAFAKIWDRNDLGPRPTAFVPSAFLHHFGLGADGIVPLLKQAGVTSLSTPFARMRCARPPRFPGFDFDDGLMTYDRGQDLFPWNASDTHPEAPLNGPVCGLHWANLLHKDPKKNDTVVQRWIQYLRPYGRRIDTMLAPNTDSFTGQLRFHAWAKATLEDNQVTIIKDRAADKYGLGEVVFLRCQTRLPACFESDEVEITCLSPVAQEAQLLYELALRIPDRVHNIHINAYPVGA